MQDDFELIPLLDPTKVFTDDILVHILRLLTPRQLLKCSLVSTQWHRAASLENIWQEICHNRWQGKVYVPAAGETNLTWKQKYLKAEAEKKESTATVTFTELTTFPWRFRFTHSSTHHYV